MYDQKKYFYLLIAISVVWRLISPTTATPASYDQRQTGDVNVHIDVKDVQVIAFLDKEFLDDYTDVNYVYDYADFTIKPSIKPTSTGSSAITDEPLSTNLSTKPSTLSTSSSSDADAEIISSASDTISLTTVTPSSPIDGAENVSITVADESDMTPTTAKMDTTNNSQDNLEKLSIHPEISAKVSEKRCRSGTLGDGNGRCRKINRRRMSLLPRLAMKLAPKLAEGGASKDLRVVSWMSPST